MDMKIDNHNFLNTLFNKDVSNIRNENEIENIEGLKTPNKTSSEYLTRISFSKDNIRINENKPLLKGPEYNHSKMKSFLDELELSKSNLRENTVIKVGEFNFLSDDMMALINLFINYYKAMIEKFERSRELGNMLMSIEIILADSSKNILNKKADMVVAASVTGAGLSLGLNIGGASMSIFGMGKGLVTGNTNQTILKGNTLTNIAPSLSGIAEQPMQAEAIRIEAEVKGNDAATSVAGQLVNNNNELQRNEADIIKALLQGIETIIHATQDVASTIGSNLKG
ncbi:type III secretion protein [Proteus sp. NMG38-2]|uniref:type III secretion protein n=1 Tax=Proteus sp. NMG38-2 TaxID=2883107 RepID=UPI001D0ABA61|nr:type III secretion protein [Proteus sp. NMG38-2]UDN35670.1 type III secretion protein [Proteus sp. NMG38-2]